MWGLTSIGGFIGLSQETIYWRPRKVKNLRKGRFWAQKFNLPKKGFPWFNFNTWGPKVGTFQFFSTPRWARDFPFYHEPLTFLTKVPLKENFGQIRD